jgi:hypothetical protein
VVILLAGFKVSHHVPSEQQIDIGEVGKPDEHLGATGNFGRRQKPLRDPRLILTSAMGRFLLHIITQRRAIMGNGQ